MMKKIFSIATLMALAALVSLSALAQPKDFQKKDKSEWKEKVQAEKVAYLTTALDLTVEESQAFWPVYNQVQKDKDNAFKDVTAAVGALKDALNEGKTGKEIEVLLQCYFTAKEDSDAIDKAAVEQYKAVLPMEKIAKLYISEEKFRHQQIKRLNKEHKPGEGHSHQDGARSQQPPRGNGFRGGWSGGNDGFDE